MLIYLPTFEMMMNEDKSIVWNYENSVKLIKLLWIFIDCDEKWQKFANLLKMSRAYFFESQGSLEPDGYEFDKNEVRYI